MKIENGSLNFSYKDDGKGLNLEKIRNKAIANKMIEDSEVLEPEELANFIFNSGFSTAEKTTEISGRGVGMDAVKKFIEKKGGDIQIKFDGINGNSKNFVPFEILFSLPGKYAVKQLSN